MAGDVGNGGEQWLSKELFPGKIKMQNLKSSTKLIDFLSDNALYQFIELKGVENYPIGRRRWPESRTEVAGGELDFSKMDFVVWL